MKNQKLLDLIKERLNQLGPQEVLKQLYECRVEGPSVEEFFDNDIEYSDFFDEAYSVPFNQDFRCHAVLVAANDEFEAWEDRSLYDLAA